MGAVTNWIERNYGVRVETTERNVVLNVTTTVRVLQNNPNRMAWRIFNMSAGTAYVGFGGQVTVLNGIQLNPTGGSAGTIVRDDLELTTREMWGIATAAVTLTVFETIVIKEM